MKKSLLLSLVALLSIVYTYSQDWNIDKIPDSLKINSNAVIRFSSENIERLSVKKYENHIHKVITILNKNGSSNAELNVYYDDKSSVDFIEGNIYNAAGTLIKSIKKKDIEDYASNSSYTLYSDNRVKYYDPLNASYPYTVEYIYNISYSSVVGFPIWMPLPGYNIATQESSLSILTSKQFEVLHKELNYNISFEKEEIEDNKEQLTWTASNIKAIAYEKFTPDYLEILPVVIITPVDISYEGYAGDFSSWKNYGKWVYLLLENRDILPESTIIEIKKLTENLKTDKGKVEVLYKYMQNKTRYVNVALGIGGFQPAYATEVDEKGYGDCKALSNYMRTLLKYAGISSFYTEIGNGNTRKIMFNDFPSINQTNHVILCVPLESDTVWLECTNQDIPFGYIGSSNSDRYCLLITPEGGVISKTPPYEAENNIRLTNLKIDLKEDGSAEFNLNTEYNNCFIEDILYLYGLSKENQKNSLLSTLEGNGLAINEFTVSNDFENYRKGFIKVNGNLTGFASKTGSRLFIEPNFLLSENLKTTISNTRQNDLYEPVGKILKDTLNISLPKTYSLEFLPEDGEIKTDYGSYKLSYKNDGENLIIERIIEINNGVFIPDQFSDINLLLDYISGKEYEKIILKKNN